MTWARAREGKTAVDLPSGRHRKKMAWHKVHTVPEDPRPRTSNQIQPSTSFLGTCCPPGPKALPPSFSHPIIPATATALDDVSMSSQVKSSVLSIALNSVISVTNQTGILSGVTSSDHDMGKESAVEKPRTCGTGREWRLFWGPVGWHGASK